MNENILERAAEGVAAWLLHRFGPNTPEAREANTLLAAIKSQREQNAGEAVPDYWAAIAPDGEIVLAYSTHGGEESEAARSECNQYINDALLNDHIALRLTPLHTRPAQAVSVPDAIYAFASFLHELPDDDDGYQHGPMKVMYSQEGLEEAWWATQDETNKWAARFISERLPMLASAPPHQKATSAMRFIGDQNHENV